MKTLKTIVLLLVLLPCIGCENQSRSNPADFHTNGLIIFDGDPSVDGCGWLIKIDTTLYAPKNLNQEFKIDSLKVVLNYNLLDETWTCGWREPGYKYIEIVSIKVN